MTLLARIQNLQLRAVAADDVHKIRARVGEFAMLREQVETSTSTATRVGVGREELLVAGMLDDHYEQNRTSVITVVEDLITTATSLPVDAKIDAARLQVRAVADFFLKSQKWVEDQWATTRSSQVPAVDEELLDALEHGGVDVEQIREDITRARDALLVLGYRPIPEVGDHAKLIRARATLESVGERIAGLIDPRLADVIMRAQAGGILYSEMTDDVVAGLRQLGILKRVRVVLT